MCGIAGIIGVDGPVDPSRLASMNRMIAHRGPDDTGEWVSEDGRVGLANRRLAILDLSPAGHQPMCSAETGCVVAFNGEIYNFIEVREELMARGRRFRTQTDTEVVLAAYDAWGEDFVTRLNGMFAFAIWDPQRRALFAARDRFGEKPFYYHSSPARFVFASEIKALLVDPSVPRRPELPVLARYLEDAQLDGDTHTFFEDIRQLEPAHALVATLDGAVRTRRYWQLPLARKVRIPPRDVPEAFRELLFDSIRLRLRSDVAVGSSLSGGLDSSSIVCGMRMLLGQYAGTQNTFSARYRAGNDEGPFIQAVVDQTGVVAHHVFIDGAQLTDDLERFLWFQDEPVAHTSQYAQWKVMELAKQVGVTVLLDGQGADEIIGGYPSPTFGYRYAEIVRKGRMLELAHELIAFRHHHGSLTPALRYTGAALIPGSVRQLARRRAHGTSALSIPGVAHRNGWQMPADARRAPALRRALYQTLTSTSLPSLLRYGDRNSMAFSREARLPFLDHRLVEFVYTLPPDALVRDGASKIVLRDAMQGILPDIVRWRMDKVGFATPEREWFLGPLRPWLQDALSGFTRRGLLPASAVDAQWGRFVRGGSSGSVWRLANLENWFRGFVDQTPAPSC